MQYLGLVDEKEVPVGYDKYLWVSKRCIDGIKWCDNNNVKYLVMENRWTVDNKIQKAIEYLNGVKKEVLKYAVAILNDYHHSQYSLTQWNIMLSQWLNVFLDSLYDKYLNILSIESQMKECECYTYSITLPVIPVDYNDFIELAFNTDEYHCFQYAMLFSEMKPLKYIHIKEKGEYRRPAVRHVKKTRGIKKVALYRLFTQIVKNSTRIQDKVVIQGSYLPNDFVLSIMKKGRGKITNYIFDYYRFERIRIPTKIDYEWRKKNDYINTKKDIFTALICKLLKSNLPIAYVEGFGYLQDRVKKLYKFAMNPNAVFFAAAGSSNDEIFKTYLMRIRRSEAVFCDIQHGGNYGIDKSNFIKSEMEICDVFYTWGWKLDKSCIFKPMPAAKLLDSRLNSIKKGNDILYVNYICEKNITRLNKLELIYESDRLKELNFFRSLKQEVREKIIVRMYMNDYGWNMKKEIEKVAPGIRFDESTDYYDSLGNARLVVLSCWSTTIIEALYANKPILVLRDRSFAEDDAIEDIIDMEHAGILVDSWENLLNRIEEIYLSIDVWWNEPKRQMIIERIKGKYAYMPQNAKEIWTKEIIDYIYKRKDSNNGKACN